MKLTIDKNIEKLISDLNAAGNVTFSSCEGKTNESQFATDDHCKHAFISFEQPLSKIMRKKARQCNLWVYNGGLSVTALSGKEDSIELIIQRNIAFEGNIRKLFDL